MKQLLKLLVLALVFILTTTVNAGEVPPKSSSQSIEIIVSFEKYTPKLSAEFTSAINSLVGIQQKGGCEKMNIVYFSYDSSIYKSSGEAFHAIEVALKRFNPLLKIGSSSDEVERACN